MRECWNRSPIFTPSGSCCSVRVLILLIVVELGISVQRCMSIYYFILARHGADFCAVLGGTDSGSSGISVATGVLVRETKLAENEQIEAKDASETFQA